MEVKMEDSLGWKIRTSKIVFRRTREGADPRSVAQMKTVFIGIIKLKFESERISGDKIS